jgi:homocysteine S-methyltransferase
VDAGAEFIVTQPVFEPTRLEAFLQRANPGIPVLAGIWPLASLRNAEFLANEVPGVALPESVLARMRAAQERGDDAAQAEGIAIAREIRDAIRDLVQGVHVSAPLGRVEAAVETITG